MNLTYTDFKPICSQVCLCYKWNSWYLTLTIHLLHTIYLFLYTQLSTIFFIYLLLIYYRQLRSTGTKQLFIPRVKKRGMDERPSLSLHKHYRAICLPYVIRTAITMTSLRKLPPHSSSITSFLTTICFEPSHDIGYELVLVRIRSSIID